MSRVNRGGHVRTLGGITQYRLIRVMIDGKSKQVLEHRHLMSLHLGRPLEKWEIVHHKDEDGLNNAIDNLEIMSQSKHQNEHLMTGPRKWPLDEAMQLHSQGVTLGKLGEKYGVAWTVIRAAFVRRGISTINKKWGTCNPQKWSIDEAMKLLSSGLNMEQVGKALGVTSTAVRTMLKKKGLYQPKVQKKSRRLAERIKVECLHHIRMQSRQVNHQT